MDIMRGVLTVAITLLLGAVGSLLANELNCYFDVLANSIIRFALSLLPEGTRKRYEEEWRSHLYDCQSAFVKIRHSLGCLYCATFRAKYLKAAEPETEHSSVSEAKVQVISSLTTAEVARPIVVEMVKPTLDVIPSPIISYTIPYHTVVDSRFILGERHTGMNDLFEDSYYQNNREE